MKMKIIVPNISRVTMLYKITHNLVAIDPNLYLVKQPIMHTRNSNVLQYQLFNTRTNYFKYSFFPHTVVLWNSLSHATLIWHPLWTNLSLWSKAITTVILLSLQILGKGGACFYHQILETLHKWCKQLII